MKNPLPIKSPGRGTMPAAILLTALALLAYANTFDAPFVFDAIPDIRDNAFIRMTELTPESLSQTVKGDHPLAGITLAANYYFHAYDVRGYHAVSLVIHILTGLLVFLLTRQTLRLCGTESTVTPFFAAALWLVNPLHTQSVTYIGERITALAAMFSLLALACYIQGRLLQIRKSGRPAVIFFFSGCGLSCIFGLASKEITAVLPLMIFLYEWYFFQNLDRAWLKRQAGRVCGLILLLIIISLIFLGRDPIAKLTELYAIQDFTPAQRLLTETSVVIYYISLLLFPHPARLNLFYDFPVSRSLAHPATFVPAMAALLLLMIAAVYAARRHRLPSFAAFWFLIALIIESSIIGLDLVYEHRTYLPSIFPFIGLTFLIFRYVRPRAAAVIILCVAIGGCSFWTYRRNGVWSDAIALWQDNVAKSPRKATPLGNLGGAYFALQKYDQAMDCFQRALQLSNWQEFAYQHLLYGIGEVLLQKEQPREAAALFKSLIGSYPGFEKGYVKLGVALLHLGRTDEAMESSRRALEIDPNLDKAYNTLGVAWYRKGDVSRATAAFSQALAINPESPEARNNLKKIKPVIDRYGADITRLKTAAEQQPGNQQLFHQLGQVYQAAGMIDQAIAAYERTLALNPERPVILNALGHVYASAGRIADAAETLEQLAEIVPDNATVHYNLACLYARLNEKEKSVAVLRQAVQLGYNRWDLMKADKDLKNISDTDYYKSLVSEKVHP